MTKPEFGTKRVCAACNLRFYDLNQTPVVCPRCAAAVVVPTPAPARPPRRPFQRPTPAMMPVPFIAEEAELADDAIVDDAETDTPDASAAEEEKVGDQDDDAAVPTLNDMDDE